MRIKLVDDVGNLYRRWSTRIAASQAGLVLFWASLPADLRAAVPPDVLMVVVGIFAVSFISAQAVSQPKLRKDQDQPKGDQP